MILTFVVEFWVCLKLKVSNQQGLVQPVAKHNHKYEKAIRMHYENSNMQYSVQQFEMPLQIENFQMKKFDIFHIFARNMDFVFTLQPSRRGSADEYPQNLYFGSKQLYTPSNPSFATNVWFKGVYMSRTCYSDEAIRRISIYFLNAGHSSTLTLRPAQTTTY